MVTYTATGTLEANNKVDLTTESAGTITHILTKEGESVHRGQVLMQLKADKQIAQVQESVAGISASQGGIEQQKADINQAKARLDSASVKLRLAQSELQRYERLYKDQFVSQLELDQKRTNFDTASADYQEALQGLSSSRARYAQAASSLSQARSSYRYNVAVANESLIRAPFSGIIGQKYVYLGDYVSPGQKLLTVVDPSSFKIQFSVPERYLHQLRVGLPVAVSFDGLGDAHYAGSVGFIDPVIDPEAHTVMVKAILPNAAGLRHGLFGSIDLGLGTIANAVVIPEEAIVPQGEKTFVYVVRREIYQPSTPKTDAKAKTAALLAAQKPTTVAHLQEVTVGHRKAGTVQIESGLQMGDQVIINGLQKVNDNMEVHLSSDPMPMGTKGH
jgi:membrane fusion protein (multidrug efflux system)